MHMISAKVPEHWAERFKPFRDEVGRDGRWWYHLDDEHLELLDSVMGSHNLVRLGYVYVTRDEYKRIIATVEWRQVA